MRVRVRARMCVHVCACPQFPGPGYVPPAVVDLPPSPNDRYSAVKAHYDGGINMLLARNVCVRASQSFRLIFYSRPSDSWLHASDMWSCRLKGFFYVRPPTLYLLFVCARAWERRGVWPSRTVSWCSV